MNFSTMKTICPPMLPRILQATLLACLPVSAVLADDQAVQPTLTESSAAAETVIALPPAPLTQLCGKLGRPLKADEVGKLSAHVVTDISASYREVLGQFSTNRTRSTRYLSDGTKTAQFVTLSGRQLCLATPNSPEPFCGVPLVCESGEADYVMVDAQDEPFVRIDTPTTPAADAAALAEDADWVLYAGGTAGMPPPTGLVGSGAVSPSRNTRGPQDCVVGAGYPPLDKAWAYYWNSDCGRNYASGIGDVVYIDKSGDIFSLPLGPGRGLQTDQGQLTWSVSEAPLPISVECRTATDDSIPTSADEVNAIRVSITVPPKLNYTDSVVYAELVDGANVYAKRICGRDSLALPGRTEYTIHPSGKDTKGNITLRWGPGAKPTDGSEPAFVVARTAAASATSAGQRVFGRLLRILAEEDRRTQVMAALSGSATLNNLANGLRSADVETLVALIDGFRTRMPWKEAPPLFSNGQFLQTWSLTSFDPIDSYLPSDMDSKAGWKAVLKSVPPGLYSVQLRVTCRIEASEATELPPEQWVEVFGTLLEFANGEMVLQCSAP